MTHHDSDAVQLAGLNGEQWAVRPGVIDAQAVEAYESGHCLTLAVAIAERTQWAVMLHLSHYGDGAMALVHAYAKTRDGKLVDIRGAHDRRFVESGLSPNDQLHETAFDDIRDLAEYFGPYLPEQDAWLAATMVDPILRNETVGGGV